MTKFAEHFRRHAGFLAAFLIALLLAACAAPPPARVDRVVLLPNEDGRPSMVTVTRRDGKSVELKSPYDSAQISSVAIASTATTADAVRSRYATLLSVQPARVKSFTLYFEFNRAVLTAQSQREVDRVLAEAALAPAAEIDVIGHTDSRGTVQLNDALGLTRAQYVAGLMEARGFDRKRLSVQSRGERELLVPTPDETEEPRNRRVEIRLR
jgi:OOP family OmpA-OmpF porin